MYSLKHRPSKYYTKTVRTFSVEYSPFVETNNQIEILVTYGLSVTNCVNRLDHPISLPQNVMSVILWFCIYIVKENKDVYDCQKVGGISIASVVSKRSQL